MSAIGYGTVALAPGMYGAPIDDRAAVAAIRHAIERGVTLIDTADAYGMGYCEDLVGRAVVGRRNEVVVSTKFGQMPRPGSARFIPSPWGEDLRIDGRPEHVRGYAEDSLRRLNLDVIDLYYLHWPDPQTPIEETVGAMADLVHDGLVRFIGLSNVTGEQLGRAVRVHPVATIQVECSLWARDAENDAIPAARSLGSGVVVWSPLGTGFLSGDVQVEPDDFRKNIPRFTQAHLASSNQAYDGIRGLAGQLGVRPAQLALAWLMNQSPPIVPIPSSKSFDHIDDNIAAAALVLDDDLMARVRSAVTAGGLHVPDPAPVVHS